MKKSKKIVYNNHKRTAPNWDTFRKKIITVPRLLSDDEGEGYGDLDGICKGFGETPDDNASYMPANPGNGRHLDTIGIYGFDGSYYNICINTRVKSTIATFFIDEVPYYYPLVASWDVDEVINAKARKSRIVEFGRWPR